MLVPALLLVANRLSGRGGRVTPARMIEGSLLALGIVDGRHVCFCQGAGRTGDLAGFTLRADPAAHLGGVAFRTERNQRGHAGGHVSSDLGGDARTWSVSAPESGGKCARLTDVSHRHGHSAHVPKRAVGGRKRSQQALHEVEDDARRHREQINLLSRVSLLGEMTASLAHELNQPLSAIISNANAGMRFIDRGKEDPATLRDILVDVVADGASRPRHHPERAQHN